MHKRQPGSPRKLLLPCLIALSALHLAAQQPIGRTSATEVKVSGAVDISHGETLLGNGSDITAGGQAVKIVLQRGGSLQLCSTSNVYLAKDGSIDDRTSSALMMALGRGAIEANYTVGKYSDVLMTPDLRILVSGPGEASLSVRVNTKGDTCVDNSGADAPYVTVSSQLEGGAYRVMPNQRVSFQHGSLLEVVDHEPEPCGCPSASGASLARGSGPAPLGGPSSKPADTAFPIAESEGLAPPPKPPTTPVVPAGQAHAEVSVPLVYNGETPAPPPVSSGSPPASAAHASAPPAGTAASSKEPVPVAAPQAAPPAAPAPVANSTLGRPSGGGNIFHSIGHFFSKLFGH